jgi:hypothetical protein
MKKYHIIILLFALVLLAIFGAVFFVGKNKEEIAINVPAPDPQTSTTTTPKKEIVSTPGVILTGDRAKYENLSEEEKKIIDRYTEKYPAVYKEILAGTGNEIAAKNYFPLKYYDDKTVVIAVTNEKGAFNVLVYDAQTLEQINDYLKVPLAIFGTIFENADYIISSNGAQYFYYKKGERETKTVAGSLLTSKNETYVKIGGFGDQYDFTFDAESKLLSVSVFKPINSSSLPNPKIRTATFVLP